LERRTVRRGIPVADHLMLVYPLPMALMLMAIGAIVLTILLWSVLRATLGGAA
jgi:hypothetical protein